MNIKIAIPADQLEYLEAKAEVLEKTIPELIVNLLTYGRLTPPCDSKSFRASPFFETGVKRLAEKEAAK